jgi:hypothetical protein
MKKFVLLLLSGSVAFGAGLPTTHLQGDYVEARTADIYTGPCFANSEGGLSGELAVFGWRISKGAFQGVNLEGLSVVGVVRATTTLGDFFTPSNPAKSVIIIDERANPEQRLALKQFAQRMSKGLLEDVVRVDYEPVSITFDNENVHSMTATLNAGKLANIKTRAIGNGDHFCANEETWYSPLTELNHAMPAYALAHNFKGEGLGTKWDFPGKRSAFVGSFELND